MLETNFKTPRKFQFKRKLSLLGKYLVFLFYELFYTPVFFRKQHSRLQLNKTLTWIIKDTTNQNTFMVLNISNFSS